MSCRGEQDFARCLCSCCLPTLLAISFTPLAVSNGFRLWVWWQARQEGLIVPDRQDRRAILASGSAPWSPYLRRLRERIPYRSDCAAQASLDLNFKRILLRTVAATPFAAFRFSNCVGICARSNPAGRAITQRGWATLHKLLPAESQRRQLGRYALEDGPTVILLRNAFLSREAKSEAGRLMPAEVMVASPWFRQTFSRLRWCNQLAGQSPDARRS